MATNLMKYAKSNKADEFYTQLEDIEKEMVYYRNHFKDKIIFCNCDDPYESNFFKFFAMNFQFLQLKKLIATCYNGSPISGKELNLFPSGEKLAYKIEITEIPDSNNDGTIDLYDVENLLKSNKNTLSLLKGNGDFRSDECIELLKEADIIVTNPPFSLFREYISLIFQYKKQFLIIGNQNAITYKEIFPLIRDNKMWLGLSMNGSNRFFQVPDYYPLTEKTGKIINDKKFAFVKGVVWFTNLTNPRRNEELILYKKYNKTDYATYENFDAINVDKVSEIPVDYNGMMGVPITFLHKYNPNQFKIIGLGISNSGLEIGVLPYKYEHKKYRKEVQKRGAVDGDLYLLDDYNHPIVPFARIIIRRT